MSWNKNTINMSALEAMRCMLEDLHEPYEVQVIAEFRGLGLNDDFADDDMHQLRRLRYRDTVILEYVNMHSDCDTDDVISSRRFPLKDEPKDWQPIRHINDDAGVEQASREFLGLPQGMPLYKSRHLVGEESYKAGQKSVVEWVEQHSPILIAGQDIASVAGNELRQQVSYYPIIRLLDWQAQLKEWGI